MDMRLRTHPLIVIAAIAVILTCLLAIGVMIGVVPSPLAKERRAVDFTTYSNPAVDSRTASQNAYAPVPAAKSDSERSSSRTQGPVGASSGSGASQSLAGGAPAAAPVCDNCGSVTAVRAVKQQGEASIIGPAAGGLIGGVVGNQIGSGRGNTIATIAGAAVGAGAGTEIERRYKSTTHYVVEVRMNDGRVRHFNYASAPGFQSGDKVRVVDGRLSRG